MINQKKLFICNLLLLLCAFSNTYIKTNHLKNIHWGVSTRQGERNYMEDCYTITQFSDKPNLNPHENCFFGVYDGHGGGNVSEELKEMLHEIFYTHWKKQNKTPAKALEYALIDVEENLRPHSNDLLNPVHHAGSTAVATVLHNNKLYIANVGDSRAIIIRNGEVVFSTEDHKPNLPKERNRIEGAGHRLDQVKPGHTPRIKGLSLSRTIGDWDKKIQHPRSIICNPDHYVFTPKPGDILIVASDGLWDVLSNNGVGILTKEILSRYKLFDPEDAITERKQKDYDYDEKMPEKSKSIKFASAPDKKYEKTEGNKSTMRTLTKALRDVAYHRGSGDNITVVAAQFNTTPKKQTKNNIDQSINLLIQNAQELKRVLDQKLHNGLPQILLNNIDASLKYLKKEVLEELNKD